MARRETHGKFSAGPRSYAMTAEALEKLEKLQGLLGESKKDILSLAIRHLYDDYLRGRVVGIEQSLITVEGDGKR